MQTIQNSNALCIVTLVGFYDDIRRDFGRYQLVLSETIEACIDAVANNIVTHKHDIHSIIQARHNILKVDAL